MIIMSTMAKLRISTNIGTGPMKQTKNLTFFINLLSQELMNSLTILVRTLVRD